MTLQRVRYCEPFTKFENPKTFYSLIEKKEDLRWTCRIKIHYVLSARILRVEGETLVDEWDKERGEKPAGKWDSGTKDREKQSIWVRANANSERPIGRLRRDCYCAYVSVCATVRGCVFVERVTEWLAERWTYIHNTSQRKKCSYLLRESNSRLLTR